MGVPLNHPYNEGIFPYKPTILGYPHDCGNPHMLGIHPKTHQSEKLELGVTPGVQDLEGGRGENGPGSTARTRDERQISHWDHGGVAAGLFAGWDLKSWRLPLV